MLDPGEPAETALAVTDDEQRLKFQAIEPALRLVPLVVLASTPVSRSTLTALARPDREWAGARTGSLMLWARQGLRVPARQMA